MCAHVLCVCGVCVCTCAVCVHVLCVCVCVCVYVCILTSWWSPKCLANLNHVHNDSFDSISFTFNLSNQSGHLVAVKSIARLTVNVDHSHGVCEGLITPG